MKRDFKDIINNLQTTIAPYDYSTDFNKVFKNVEEVEYQLNQLDFLIGKKNIYESFSFLLNKDINVVKVFPLLLARREKEIDVYDLEKKLPILYKFDGSMDIDDYFAFFDKTGLKKLYEESIISSTYDYVLGIEVGLDSNARKNRTGKSMENIVEQFLIEANVNYKKELSYIKIKNELGIDLLTTAKKLNHKTNKRFDFVVVENSKIFLIEVNYYSVSGSKLNETASSYIKLSQEIKNANMAEFIWITDGKGWESTANSLKEAHKKIDNLYTLKDLENGVFKKIFK